MKPITTIGIRIRLLLLVIGVALPLTYLGLAGIWSMRTASRQQVDEAVKKQAELAAVSFEKWVEAQRESLTAFARESAEDGAGPSRLQQTLRSVLSAHPYWTSVSVLGADGHTVGSQPPDSAPLQDDLASDLLRMTKERSLAVEANWSRGPAQGVLLISTPTESGGAAVARVEVAAVSEMLFGELEFGDHGTLLVLGPQRRVILYRNTPSDISLGKDFSDSPVLAELGNRRTAVAELKDPGDSSPVAYGLARAGGTGCVIVVGVPSETLFVPARQLATRYIIAGVMALLCATAAALAIARGIARPVRRLSETARKFGEGELTTRAAFASSGEIEELRKSFNAMAGQIQERETRLQELDRLKSDFVSGVSHEMRTPLTTIKTLTRVLQRGNVSEPDYHQFLATIAAECDRQIDLVLNLLDLSRIEAGTFNVTLGSVDVASVVSACVAIERFNAEGRHHKLHIELPPGLPPVTADPAALRRVLCGLVQNAVKYTPDGGHITVAAAGNHNAVKIKVSDTGHGISKNDLPRIFEKFYRGTMAPAASNGSAGMDGVTGEAPGVGLGLYLARAVIEEIGGRIEVESEVGHGSAFTVSLRVWTPGTGPMSVEGDL
jgi:signal transduction histidine kinase